MEPWKEFKSVLHPDREYIPISPRFYRRWMHELGDEVYIQSEVVPGAVFCNIKLHRRQPCFVNVGETGFDNIGQIKGWYNNQLPAWYNNKLPFVVKFSYVGKKQFKCSKPILDEDPNDVGNEENGEELLWGIKLSRAMAWGGNALYIPSHVMHYVLSHRPGKIRVLLPDMKVKTWSFLWNDKRTNQCHVGDGWYDFVNEFPVGIGDKLYFWKLPGSDIICVTISNELA